MKKQTIFYILLLCFCTLFLQGCKKQYQFEIVGRFFDSSKRLVQQGTAKFCYKIYDRQAKMKVQKSKCELVNLKALTFEGEAISFRRLLKGTLSTPSPYFSFELIQNGAGFAGSVVRQDGIHKNKKGIYEGRAVVEFYPD